MIHSFAIVYLALALASLGGCSSVVDFDDSALDEPGTGGESGNAGQGGSSGIGGDGGAGAAGSAGAASDGAGRVDR